MKKLDPQVIVGLQSENVKRVKAIRVVPRGNVVKVGGRNGQGKSSLLDGIMFALAGKSVEPPKVIREGQEHAEVILELTDLIVEARWTTKGRYLEVRSKDGKREPWASLNRNPVARYDFRELVRRGFAAHVGEGDPTRSPIELTERGVEALRRWVRVEDGTR